MPQSTGRPSATAKTSSRSRPAAKRPRAAAVAAPERASSREPVDNVSRVYHELRSLIVRGQLPPGARIAERAVVARTGLSRTPVRSALHRLQQEGFVASVGRAGDQRLIVTPLTQDDGREVFLVVGHLEGLAAREAATLPLDERRKLARQLREINKTLAVEAKGRSAPSRLFDLDYQFHQAYVEGAAGPRLVALHHAIKPQTERYARLYVDILLDELPTSVKEHGVIADAIADGKADAAQGAVERNWHNAADRLSKVIAEHGERGIWHLWHHDVPPETGSRAGRRR